MFPDYSKIILQPLKTPWLSAAETEAAMLRLDLLHPEVSGNKWFKLKYNIEAAIRQQKETLLTFGGARSNHIAATAAAARLLNLGSIGIIRGGELRKDNPTLMTAIQKGMRLRFVSRETYRHKTDERFLQSLREKFPEAYLIPEGGNNALGVKGASEILSFCKASGFTHICCPVGTGATLAGIIASAQKDQQVIGFCALKKADEQRNLIKSYLKTHALLPQWEINDAYHFGGFARRTEKLNSFMDSFQKRTSIPLDFVYTAKMMFGIKDLAEKDYFPPHSKLLIIHTGGLQGNK